VAEAEECRICLDPRRDPAVIAIFGVGPVDMQLVDPTQPSWRQV